MCLSQYSMANVPMAYNEAYDTIRGTAHEMSVLGTSSFTIANQNALSGTLQKDVPHDEYETMDSIRNKDPPPLYTQVVRPDDQASSGIYETIPAEHLDNTYDEADYI